MKGDDFSRAARAAQTAGALAAEGRSSRRETIYETAFRVQASMKQTRHFVCAVTWLSCFALVGRGTAEQAQKFEVASVRIMQDRDKLPVAQQMFYMSPPGAAQFTVRNVNLGFLIAWAFRTSGSAHPIAKRPAWMDSTYYEITAKPEGDVGLSYDELRPMLQELLQERFHLTYHMDTTRTKGYALVVTNGGPKIAPTKGEAQHAYLMTGRLDAANVPMNIVASLLTHALGQTVVDETNLKGNYDMKLKFAEMDETELNNTNVSGSGGHVLLDFALADGISVPWLAYYLSLPMVAESYPGKVTEACWQAFATLSLILLNPRRIYSVIPEKIPGSDFFWDLVKVADEQHLSIFLLGGFGDTPEVVAKKILAKCPNVKIAGWSNEAPSAMGLVAKIDAASPDILMVAYGPVKQEMWIAQNLHQLNCTLAIGVGGTFDYVAGLKSQPPAWVRAVGFEWLYRLFTQPARAGRIWRATAAARARRSSRESLPHHAPARERRGCYN